MKKIICITGLSLLVCSTFVYSGVPTGINYQGRYEEGGTPVTGTRVFRFKIYDAEVGGNLLWDSGDVSLSVVNGLFNYVLDCSNIDWKNTTPYLEVSVGGTVLSPREKIQSSPYAFYSSSASYADSAGLAENANKLGGQSPSYYLDTSAAAQTKSGDLTVNNLYVGSKVGIGTTSPIKKLHIVDTNGGIFFDGSDSTFNRFKSTAVDPAIGKDLLISAQNPGNTPDLYIKSNGNVGIGTTGPQANFHLYTGTFLLGTSSSKQLRIRDTGAAVDIESIGVPLYINNTTGQNTYIMGGNVGIGTTSPASKLDVNGAITARGNLEVKHTSNPGIELRDTDGGTPYIDFSTDTVSDYNGRIIYSGGDFQTQGTKLLDLVESDIRTRWTNGTPWVWLRRTGTTIAADIGGRIVFDSSFDTAGNIASLVYIDGRKENATSGDTASYLRIYTRPSVGGITETLRIDSNGHVLPRRTAGTQNLGDATYYWNDVSYKTLTDRGCLGWFDDGVELQDGRIVSDVEAIKQIKPHPTKKTVYGKPMLDYRTLPKVVYKPAAINGVPLPRDENDEPYLITTEEVELTDNNGKPVLDKDGKPITVKKVVKRQAADGAELTSLISIMLGAIKELDAKIVALEQKNAELEKEIEMLRKQ